jgi:hypothetical protein
MDIHEYFADISEELKRKSDRVRKGFASHRPSAGENREEIIGDDLLRPYLPKTFGVGTGLVLSSSGELSKQADLLVVNQSWNAPLYPTGANQIWLVEAVYALIEVKTSLSPSTLEDAFEKCRRFKTLPRQFDDGPDVRPRIGDSLFVLWAFDGPSPETAKENIVAALEGVPRDEQPDIVVVLNSIIATAGRYRELVKIGQEGSPYRQQVMGQSGWDIDRAMGEPVEVMNLGPNTLLAFIMWLTSWLKQAGPRSAPLLTAYMPDRIWGHLI